MEAGKVDEAAPQGAEETVRYAGDKTFYVDENGYWVDSTFADSGLEPTEITYLSDEYYQLIADEPDLAQYLGVAEKVIVVWNDKAYKIVPSQDDQANP
jgi:hypothetical protein